VKGIVLAAGRGERLRPFTEEIPKPLLPVVNIPVLEFALASLESAGVDELGVNVFHAAERIMPYLETRHPRVPLVISRITTAAAFLSFTCAPATGAPCGSRTRPASG